MYNGNNFTHLSVRSTKSRAIQYSNKILETMIRSNLIKNDFSGYKISEIYCHVVNRAGKQ